MEGKKGGGPSLGTCARATSLSTKQLFHWGSGAHVESFIKPPVHQSPVFFRLQVSSHLHISSHICTCTATLNFSRHYLDKLHVWTQISISVETDSNLTLPLASSLVSCLCYAHLSSCMKRVCYCVKNQSKQVVMLLTLHEVQLLHTLFNLPLSLALSLCPNICSIDTNVK